MRRGEPYRVKFSENASHSLLNYLLAPPSSSLRLFPSSCQQEGKSNREAEVLLFISMPYDCLLITHELQSKLLVSHLVSPILLP